MAYRDKIEGNELDLSLNQLTEVPVKELAAVPKATCLDLSCNRIQILPNDFATLTHLVKIDLSQNRLSELPAKFGNLLNLQHLDLYGNNIQSLPVSFCRLKNLKWLDLKNNPLEPKLKNVAGDCLDEKACHACAKKVVAYMQSIESELEREKQKRLKAVREKEAIERAKMEKELEEQRRFKKIEKEKRKAESKAKRETELLEDGLQDFKNLNISKETDKGDRERAKASSKSSSWLKLLYSCGVAIFLMIFFGLFYGIQNKIVSEANIRFAVNNILVNLKSSFIEVTKLIIFYIPKVREAVLKLLFQYMETLSYFSSKIEQFVAYYV